MRLFIARSFIRASPILYMIFIWLQSSYFNPSLVESYLVHIDFPVFFILGGVFELAHLVEFGFLYLLLFLAFLSLGEVSVKREMLAFAISFFYGLSDEIHQIFIPYRSFSWVDLTKNTIGIFIIWWAVHRSYFINNSSKFGIALKKISSL